MRDLSSAHRRLLRDLIAAREAAGLTQSGIGNRIGWRQARVSRLETGAARPRPEDVATWMRATGSPESEVERLTEIAKDLAVEVRSFRGDPDPAAQQALYAAHEAAASKIVLFQPTIIPGLVQTDEYAAAVLRYFYPGQDAAPIAAARVERAWRALHRPQVPVVLIIHEDALRRRVVPDRVLARQLDRLAEMISDPELSHVAVAVVPAGLPEPDVPSSSFTLLEGDQPLVIPEYRTGVTFVHDEDEIATYRGSAEAWLKVAATGADAEAILRQVRDDLQRG